MILGFDYSKQSTHQGVLYLHGWEYGPFTDEWREKSYSFYKQATQTGRWINASLRHFDEQLPEELHPGLFLMCEAEFIDQSGPFTTFYLQRIYWTMDWITAERSPA